ncbi:MAG: sulfatase-like hydrolase/transferase [Chitinophagaceae bacterium]
MKINRIAALLFLLFCVQVNAQQNARPNIIFILTDDMGYGDISCFNGTYATPNIDRLAKEGRMFTSYYSASPICSPSRTGFLTGMHPAKSHITSYLQTKKGNRECGQADFLDPAKPSIARILKASGYATGHFGKWHIGGGRDVTDAPNFDKYGFDEWNSTYESPDPDPLLTATNWIWSDKDSVKRWSRTKYFVDKTLAFLAKHSSQPCYVNLWPDDVHTPWVPGDDSVGRYPGKPEEEKSFKEVLTEYDKQIGRLMAGITKLGIEKNTIIVFTSDNGPLPNFRHDRSAAYRGSKLSLYEGGIRMPFIVSWPGQIPANTTDSLSLITAYDLTATFAKLGGGVAARQEEGMDILDVFLGKSSPALRTVFWEYGRNTTSFAYPPGRDRSPSLAVREGKWKLLMNPDRSGVELYDMEKDRNETTNLAAANAKVTGMLSDKLMKWRAALP